MDYVILNRDPTADPAATLTFDGNVRIAGTLAFEFSGTGPGDFDVISVLGGADFQAGSEVELLFTYTPVVGEAFGFFRSNDLAGFEAIDFRASGLGGLSYRVTELNGDLTVTVVPEPATPLLFASGLGLLGFLGWRRQLGQSQRAQVGSPGR
jgi:hypothetical protein